jgi:hypothetical protein
MALTSAETCLRIAWECLGALGNPTLRRHVDRRAILPANRLAHRTRKTQSQE